jgi:hypothetical protein
VTEKYDREYDLHYLEIDADLNNRIQQFTDPRLISRSVHRGYKISERSPDYHVLNGRSFPYTLRESMVIVAAGEKNRLRVLNGGSEGVALHLHGHKPIVTHRDGVAVAPGQGEQRDVFWLATAQRLDLELNTDNDGLHSYGAGAWMMHDHREQGVTTNGIGPGGGKSLLIYEDYLGPRGMPEMIGGLQHLAPFFLPAYYAGELSVFSDMHDHDLLDPEPVGVTRYKRWFFWTCGLLFVLLLLAGPTVRRRTR